MDKTCSYKEVENDNVMHCDCCDAKAPIGTDGWGGYECDLCPECIAYFKEHPDKTSTPPE